MADDDDEEDDSEEEPAVVRPPQEAATTAAEQEAAADLKRKREREEEEAEEAKQIAKRQRQQREEKAREQQQRASPLPAHVPPVPEPVLPAPVPLRRPALQPVVQQQPQRPEPPQAECAEQEPPLANPPPVVPAHVEVSFAETDAADNEAADLTDHSGAPSPREDDDNENNDNDNNAGAAAEESDDEEDDEPLSKRFARTNNDHAKPQPARPQLATPRENDNDGALEALLEDDLSGCGAAAEESTANDAAIAAAMAEDLGGGAVAAAAAPPPPPVPTAVKRGPGRPRKDKAASSSSDVNCAVRYPNGSRVSVRFDDGKDYPGTVTSSNASSGNADAVLYSIDFDDGTTEDDVKESEMTPYQPSDEDDLKRLKKELLSLNDMIPTEHVTEEFGSLKANNRWKRSVRNAEGVRELCVAMMELRAQMLMNEPAAADKPAGPPLLRQGWGPGEAEYKKWHKEVKHASRNDKTTADIFEQRLNELVASRLEVDQPSAAAGSSAMPVLSKSESPEFKKLYKVHKQLGTTMNDSWGQDFNVTTDE